MYVFLERKERGEGESDTEREREREEGYRVWVTVPAVSKRPSV